MISSASGSPPGNPAQLQTPVVFLIFNRPETTGKVFNVIRQARPERLLVVADGPRADRPAEKALCAKARGVIDGVDWPCRVETLYADQNLGCMRRVSSGLDWAFALVEEAIVLEDDCLPEATFFPFCEELLARFRNDSRIAQVSGTYLHPGRLPTGDSYYFSAYNQVWGWATWRRAWQTNDNAMSDWTHFRDSGGLDALFADRRVRRYWLRVLDMVAAGDIDTWDCRWSLSCLRRGLLTVVPASNLISNIGFGPTATHTTEDDRHPLANMPCQPMRFPLTHPASVALNREMDAKTEKILYRDPSPAKKLAALWRNLCRQPSRKPQ